MINFTRYLTMTPTVRLNPHLAYNPINLVFYGNALLDNVVSILRQPAHNLWLPVYLPRPSWYEYPNRVKPTPELWCELDNSAVGGWKGPKPADRELFIGPDDTGIRMHILLYAPTDPYSPTSSALPNGTYDYWCVASIHRERWEAPASHAVDGWMEARMFAAQWFSRFADGPHSDVRSVIPVPVQNEGWYQGHWHDGDAALIQIGGQPGTILRP